MARYKDVDTSPRFLPVDLARQLQPGTFEHALNHLIDHELDLGSFDARFHKHVTGASAYPPALLLKVVLFAYSRGMVSSRSMAAACREQVTFMALTGDRAPHFTTLAAFVRSVGDDIARIFTQVLYVCDRQGLIGREMFAIDGVKLPSNASKAKSGTRAQFERQAIKLEAAVRSILARHREEDRRATAAHVADKAVRRIERLTKEAADLRRWLSTNPEERRGSPGTVRKSNRTDAESAKMATGKGVIQGYTGVAAVDGRHQIIVEVQAHGCLFNGYAAVKFRGTVRDCVPCEQRQRCLRSPETSRTRQVAFFKGKAATTPASHTDLMKQRIDTPEGRALYGRRFAIVEPVFGNLRHNKQLNRFTLRGRTKVNGQWQLYCLVHNIEKLAHQGYAQ